MHPFSPSKSKTLTCAFVSFKGGGRRVLIIHCFSFSSHEMYLKENVDWRNGTLLMLALWIMSLFFCRLHVGKIIFCHSRNPVRSFPSPSTRLATSAKSEYALIIKVQEYCYENMVFQRVFQKIILLFYNTEVLSKDTILRWYKEEHSPKVWIKCCAMRLSLRDHVVIMKGYWKKCSLFKLWTRNFDIELCLN